MGDDYSDVTWDTAGPLSERNPLTSPTQNPILSPPQNNPLSTSRPSSGYGETHNHTSSANNISTQASSSSNNNDNNKPQTLTSFAIASKGAIRVTVTDPQKHGEGGGSYVTYLVTTKTVLDSFSAPEQSVRRRFTDFVWLHRQLLEEYPAVIIPSLPEKRRMESYVTGDRFAPLFLERRRASLQTYLDRLARHPTIQRSGLLKRFLEASAIESSILSDVQPPPASSSSIRGRQSSGTSSTGVIDNLSDTLMNAFAKVKKPDERFVELRDVIEKFEENLKTVEKLTNNLEKHQTEQDMMEFSGCMTTLGIMETQITSPLSAFAETFKNVASVLKKKIEHEEADYLNALHDYINYCQSVKDVLKLRDQKQVDYEELTAYHASYSAERDRLVAGRNASGISGFFKERYRDLRGVDQEKARHAEIARLENRITELSDEAQKAQHISVAFSNEVAREVDFFQSVKVFDFKEIMTNYADSQLKFYQEGFKYWDELIPILDKMKAEKVVPEVAS
ncbi:hypothetical protein SmJEL517_g01706 [Synchytrium microbalum]|uniref:Sorting nexin-4 n=1 Tax=Synchytrium microbalum TaxID=1806994 RepID=A0A507C4N5_9FUNG|nr:uncharacterized protein SmJEL517_g01706 [Synchytrium microbalum]TPX35947.1 hypothetical protein SmJEL517_g01706 [Synchytrium microbalum]